MQQTPSPHNPALWQDDQNWTALGAGVVLLLLGARRDRSRLMGLGLVAAATPLLYRGVTGRWPSIPAPNGDTKIALGGHRGVHVRESVEVDLPVAEVYRFWRRLDNLPRFMSHLDSVTEDETTGRSHWVATGPAGVRVEWDAEIINEVENQVLGWRSLPGSDVVSAGSMNVDALDGNRTRLTVHLQYAPRAGRAGAFVASLFGRAPEQTIREDLRRLKNLLNAFAPDIL